MYIVLSRTVFKSRGLKKLFFGEEFDQSFQLHDRRSITSRSMRSREHAARESRKTGNGSSRESETRLVLHFDRNGVKVGAF